VSFLTKPIECGKTLQREILHGPHPMVRTQGSHVGMMLMQVGTSRLLWEGILLLSMKEGSLMERHIDWQGFLRPCQAKVMCGLFIHMMVYTFL
jgi:hypothetical protein